MKPKKRTFHRNPFQSCENKALSIYQNIVNYLQVTDKHNAYSEAHLELLHYRYYRVCMKPHSARDFVSAFG